MRKVLTLAAVLALVLAGLVYAELQFVSISATSTSTTVGLQPPASSVTICNGGPNTAYFRLFWQYETTGAATTASPRLDSGVCIEFSRGPGVPFFFQAISAVTSGADTATVRAWYY